MSHTPILSLASQPATRPVHDDELLTVQEAAKVLRMSVSWLHHSDIPRVHLGRNVRFLRSSLFAYARARLSHGG